MDEQGYACDHVVNNPDMFPCPICLARAQIEMGTILSGYEKAGDKVAAITPPGPSEPDPLSPTAESSD